MFRIKLVIISIMLIISYSCTSRNCFKVCKALTEKENALENKPCCGSGSSETKEIYYDEKDDKSDDQYNECNEYDECNCEGIPEKCYKNPAVTTTDNGGNNNSTPQPITPPTNPEDEVLDDDPPEVDPDPLIAPSYSIDQSCITYSSASEQDVSIMLKYTYQGIKTKLFARLKQGAVIVDGPIQLSCPATDQYAYLQHVSNPPGSLSYTVDVFTAEDPSTPLDEDIVTTSVSASSSNCGSVYQNDAKNIAIMPQTPTIVNVIKNINKIDVEIENESGGRCEGFNTGICVQPISTNAKWPDYYCIAWDEADQASNYQVLAKRAAGTGTTYTSFDLWFNSIVNGTSTTGHSKKYRSSASGSSKSHVLSTDVITSFTKPIIIFIKAFNFVNIESAMGNALSSALSFDGTELERYVMDDGSVSIVLKSINNDQNFLGGKQLSIPITISQSKHPRSTYDVFVTPLGISTHMKTGPATFDFDGINPMKIQCSNFGSLQEGYSKTTKGLKYQISFKNKSDNVEFACFPISQDNINRAREEYNVFNLNLWSGAVPPRSLFYSNLHDMYYCKDNQDNHAWIDYNKLVLENGYKALMDAVMKKANLATPYISSNWRLPYYNASIPSPTTSGSLSYHCRGKAIDFRRAFAKNKEDMKVDWATTGDLSVGLRLLERGGTKLRHGCNCERGKDQTNWKKQTDSNGWYFHMVDDVKVSYGRMIPLTPTTEIEEGYAKASHIHLQ